MEFLVILLVVAGLAIFLLKGRRTNVSIAHLPERFVVFDLETTARESKGSG
jgi:hypothetical protein